MAGLTAGACLPPSAQDLHTTTTQKSPKKRDQNAADIGHGSTDAPVAVGHAATDASIPVASKLRYPSRRTVSLTITFLSILISEIVQTQFVYLTLKKSTSYMCHI